MDIRRNVCINYIKPIGDDIRWDSDYFGYTKVTKIETVTYSFSNFDINNKSFGFKNEFKSWCKS